MEAEINKEFVFNYLAGRSSALQKQLLDAWVLNPANEELFCQWVLDWETQQPQYVVDVSHGLANFQNRLAQREATPSAGGPAVVALRRPFRPFFGWMAAAVVLAVLACGWVFRDAIRYQTYTTTAGRTSALLLADGSRVTLHPNSSLRVERFGFFQNREVHLSGEARFAVTHTATHQRFVVRTDERLDVVVLGTEFTVYARPRQSTKVVLDQGKVQLNYHGGGTARQVMMKPGELVTLAPRDLAPFRKTTAPAKRAVQAENRYVFDETTVLDLTYLLADRYGITAEVSDESLLELTLSGSFTADNAEELLTLLEEILELQITRRGDTVLISPQTES